MKIISQYEFLKYLLICSLFGLSLGYFYSVKASDAEQRLIPGGKTWKDETTDLSVPWKSLGTPSVQDYTNGPCLDSYAIFSFTYWQVA